MIHTPRLSPEGTRVAYGRDHDVWIQDLERGVESRASFDAGHDIASLCWTPDGRFLTYTSGFGERNAIYQLDTLEPGEPNLLLRDEGAVLSVGSWSGDGRVLLFMKSQPDDYRPDLWTFSLDDGTSRVFLASEFSEIAPELPPDGRFVAFLSNETGRFEFYRRRFPEGGPRIPVSRDGAVGARWSPDGTRLWYWNNEAMFEATVGSGREPFAGQPALLFEGDYPHLDSVRVRGFDYSQRKDAFLLLGVVGP